LSRHQPDVASLATGLDERDVFLIRSIEWLTFLPETADEALIKSNAVARYFLGGLSVTNPADGTDIIALGQAAAAQNLFKTLPNNIHHVFEEGEADREEYEDYQLLFGVFACHDLVDDVLGRRPKAT
jgi:nuclear pore complex protein Nup107